MAGQQEAAKVLTMHSIYSGIVTAVDHELQVSVVDVQGVLVRNCYYLTAALAPMLGVTMNATPATGAKVMLVYGGEQSFILGAITQAEDAIESYKGRVASLIDDDSRVINAKVLQTPRDEDIKGKSTGFYSPGDMYPGEMDLTNHMGVALRALLNFAQMTSGGLASVETHLLNDLVRIMSNAFAHHTCGGDHLVWSNGYCNDETHFTGHQWEADGKLSKDEPYASKGVAVYDPEKSVSGSSLESATGRWRFSRYLGFLGDMVHTFVTNPTDVLSNYHVRAARGGNFRSWVGSDGTYMVQAAGGVHIEVRKEIVIPTVFYNWTDPKLDLESMADDLNNEYLKLWGKGPDWTDLLVSCWQMRSYLRYITQFHSLARFKQFSDKGYGEVPTESSTLANSSVAAEKDKEMANGPFAYKGEASIDITPDGSITIQQGSTTSIIINQGNIQISAPGNIELVAGHTLSLKGKFVSITSGLNMEIASLFGKIEMKARTAFKLLCEIGRLWLKSDADWFGVEGNPDQSTQGDDGGSPFNDKQNKKEINKYAIVIDAPASGVLMYGKEEMILASKDNDVYVQAESGKIYAHAKQQVQVDIEGESYAPPDKIPAEHQGSLLVKAKKIGINADIVGVQANMAFSVNNKLLLTEDNCTITAPNTFIIGTKTEIYGTLATLGHIATTMVYSKAGYRGPSEDVQKLEEGDNDKFISKAPELPEEVIKEASGLSAEAQQLTETSDGMDYNRYEFNKTWRLWKLRAWEVGNSVISWHSLKRPLYSDAYDYGGYDPGAEFVKVEWAEQAKLNMTSKGKRTDIDYGPWPGTVNSPKIFCFEDGSMPVLTTPAGEFTSGSIKTQSDMKPKGYYWLGNKKDPDSSSGGAEVLYKFTSISATTQNAK